MSLEQYHDELIAVRRHLHTIPEEGWTEFTTTAFIVEKLRALGYEVLLGEKVVARDACLGRDEALVKKGIERAIGYGVKRELIDEMQELTGCVAVLQTGRPGPVFAVRFDIDCVPVTESTDAGHVPFACGFHSKHAGFMHACGHDAHTSMGLALAHWMMDNKDKLCGTVKIVFQPAEEGVRGAAAIAASGVLDDVDYFLSSHVAMLAKSGELATNLYGFLCTTKFDVTFTGQASHAGVSPQEGRNALAAAANATVQMLGISRHGMGMTRINVGQLIAGEGRNIIPSKALMKLEVRGQTMEINDYMTEQVMNICEGVSKSFGVSYEARKMGAAVDLESDACLTELLNEKGRALGLNVLDKPLNFGGSEDATILARRVQGHGGKAAFFLWGSDRPSGHHSPGFDFVEADMDKAFALWTQVVPAVLSMPKLLG